MDLKQNWKKTGKQIGHAFRDLGKTVVQTVAVGASKAAEWAESGAAEDDAERVETTEAPLDE